MEKSRLERFCDFVEKATLDVTMVICAVMLIVAWMHVIRRYVFNNALTWSEEFLRFTSSGLPCSAQASCTSGTGTWVSPSSGR